MFRKIIAVAVVAVFILNFSACGVDSSVDQPKENVAGTIYEVLIPNSYLKYSGMDAQRMCDSLLSLGEKYVTCVVAQEDGVKLSATLEQIDKLIENNNNKINGYINSFENKNDNYRFEGASDYSTVTLYCDEKLGNSSLFTVIVTTTSTFGLNNILYNKNSDWDVIIKVVNCHTDKVVIEGSVLTSEMKINNEAWEKTYVN